MTDEVVLTRRIRQVWSYATGRHYPDPYQDETGQWLCRDCGRRLSRYRGVWNEVRLRHNPRDRV